LGQPDANGKQVPPKVLARFPGARLDRLNAVTHGLIGHRF